MAQAVDGGTRPTRAALTRCRAAVAGVAKRVAKIVMSRWARMIRSRRQGRRWPAPRTSPTRGGTPIAGAESVSGERNSHRYPPRPVKGSAPAGRWTSPGVLNQHWAAVARVAVRQVVGAGSGRREWVSNRTCVTLAEPGWAWNPHGDQSARRGHPRLTGVALSNPSVRRLLHQRLGWSVQRPQRQAKERDEEAIQHWVAHQWPRINKR